MWFFPAYSRRPTGILKAFYRHFRSFSPSIREHIYHLTYPYSSSSCNLQFAQEQRQLYASALKAYLNDAFQHTHVGRAGHPKQHRGHGTLQPKEWEPTQHPFLSQSHTKPL